MSGYKRGDEDEPREEEREEEARETRRRFPMGPGAQQAQPDQQEQPTVQPLLDEQVYQAPVTTDIRVTHVAKTEAEELAEAEDQPPPDTTEGGLSREGDDNRGYDDNRRDDYNRG